MGVKVPGGIIRAIGAGLTLTGGILAAQGGGGGSGTVTSVGLSAPASILTVSNSPVTTAGTLALALANQNANTIFAGPASGAAAAPTFRAPVALDISGLTVLAASGSAAAPGHSFAADSATGLYLPSAGILNVSTSNSTPVSFNSSGLILSAASYLGFGSSGTASPDTFLFRDGVASSLALRNGTNVQNMYIYGTWTNASNWEKLVFTYSGGAFVVGTQHLGTGVARPLTVQAGGTLTHQFGIGGGLAPLSTNPGPDLGVGATPFRTLYANGGISLGEATKTVAYTAATNDRSLTCDCTSNAVLITLPASPQTGQWLTITKLDATTNAMSFVGTVSGVVNPSVAYQYGALTAHYNGTAWQFAASYSSAFAGMTGAASFGTVASVGYGFAGQPGDGMYLTASGDLRFANAGVDSFRVSNTAIGVVMPSNYSLQWGTTGVTGADTFLFRDAANVLAMHNGTAAQNFHLYGTYTNPTNYNVMTVGYNGTRFGISTSHGGTGTIQGLQFTAENGVYIDPTGAGSKWFATGGSNFPFTPTADAAYDFGQLTTRVRNILQNGIRVNAATVVTVPTTGQTVTIAAQTNCQVCAPAAAIALLTIVLPTPIGDGDEREIIVTQAILTGLTITPTSGTTTSFAITNGAATAGYVSLKIRYVLANTTWYQTT